MTGHRPTETTVDRSELTIAIVAGTGSQREWLSKTSSKAGLEMQQI
ncbi:hypothetical protein K9N68_24680 [Kovacikia minuta CCNUW1]|nr:hypothetical protein [Kovacikia minuta]UBF24825.1 hypothetical protein K9N68_24680 [Kovacikia minuta CCNUW1]